MTEQGKIYGIGSNSYYAIDPLQEPTLKKLPLTDITSRFSVLEDDEYFTKISKNYNGILGITNHYRIIYWNHIETVPIDITDHFLLEPNEQIIDISDKNFFYTSKGRLLYFVEIEDFIEEIELTFLNEGEEILSFADNRILTNQDRLIDLQQNLYQSNIFFNDVSMVVDPEEIIIFNSHSFLTSNGRIFTWGKGNNTYQKV